jgi:hypothetical protein
MSDPAESMATLPDWVVAACRAAYHGGEAAARLVGVPGPMAMVDLNRSFARCFSLAGLTPHLAAERFEQIDEDIGEIECFLAAPDLRDQLDNRTNWQRWGTTIVEIQPRGESVPHLRRVEKRWRFVVAPLDLGGGRWFVHLFDLLAPALDGHRPSIVRAFRIEAVGTAPGLHPVRMPSGHLVDLTAEDWGFALVEERRHAEVISDRLEQMRREALAKGFSVTGAWGVFGRVDRLSSPHPIEFVELRDDGVEQRRRRYPRVTRCEALSPFGDSRLVTESSRPEQTGPLTVWHVAAAVPATCRALLGIARFDLEAIGVTTVATMTDALVLSCSDADRERIRQRLARFDRLMCPDGEKAWKEEAESLSKPTFGLVVGVNKVLLGLEVGDQLLLLRSSDTAAGDHYLDPTGTHGRLDDGRTGWTFEFEQHLLTHALRTGEVALPTELPAWADDRPALIPHRASTLDDLRGLRRRVGDDSIGPGARYLSAAGFDAGPVCLGVIRDPATWKSWPWRVDGKPCRVAITRDGVQIVSDGTGPIFVVPTMRHVMGRWLQEHDPTMTGAKGCVRLPVPTRSHPALVVLLGRGAEGAGLLGGDDPLLYGHGSPGPLFAQAAPLGSGVLTARGLSKRTAKRVVAGTTQASRRTIWHLAEAVSEGARRCAGPGCAEVLFGRADQRYHSDACRKAAGRSRGRVTGRRRTVRFTERSWVDRDPSWEDRDPVHGVDWAAIEVAQ